MVAVAVEEVVEVEVAVEVEVEEVWSGLAESWSNN